MDWETFLVTNGQTFVIFIGCVLGIAAIIIYRIIARWDLVSEDKQRERDESHSGLTGEWSWKSE